MSNCHMDRTEVMNYIEMCYFGLEQHKYWTIFQRYVRNTFCYIYILFHEN